jgi:hypothetical protein
LFFTRDDREKRSGRLRESVGRWQPRRDFTLVKRAGTGNSLLVWDDCNEWENWRYELEGMTYCPPVAWSSIV